MSADPIGALVAYLKADGDTAALVGARVFAAELPDDDPAINLKAGPVKAVVVRYAGGPQQIGQGYARYGDFRADVLCYGETPHEAAKAHVAAHVALKQLRRTGQAGTVLHWCRPAGGPLSLRDPDTEWPYVMSAWQVLAGEVAI